MHLKSRFLAWLTVPSSELVAMMPVHPGPRHGMRFSSCRHEITELLTELLTESEAATSGRNKETTKQQQLGRPIAWVRMAGAPNKRRMNRKWAMPKKKM